MSVTARWQSAAPALRSVLRIVVAFMFFLAGATKLFGFPVSHRVPMGSEAWIAGLLEVIGGGLLLIGLFSRPAAFILAGEMAVAYFQVHLPKSFWPVVNGGTPAVLYCFIWLYLSAAGPGPWSVDAALHRRRRIL